MFIEIYRLIFPLSRSDPRFAGSTRLSFLSILSALCLLAPQLARCQTIETPEATVALPAETPVIEPAASAVTAVRVAKPASFKRPVESDITVSTMIPDGDYRMFSATDRCNAWTVGMEYDRNSFGYLLKARIDYAAEVLPFVLLSEPAVSDFWGNAKSPNQQYLHGLSILPVGFRFLWRSNKAIKPYVIGKLGIIAFNQKALSPSASYANFNVQAAFGMQIRLTDRVDLRVEPFEFFHVSNGYLAASNPGMDELATKIGITYHLGKQNSMER